MEEVRYTILSNLYIFLMDLKCVDFVYLLTHTPRGYIIKT